MATYHLNVNGKDVNVEADSDAPLLYVLRDNLGLHGPKFGCGLGQCGACTVHMDGKAVRSCVVPVASVATARIVTLEGLGTIDHPHPVQDAFIREQAVQCGYCINGMIMQATAFLAETPEPSEDQIRTALDANLCRCGTHTRIVKAVQRAASNLAAKGA
ncbi:(2Fe-2S)-binding protein [Bordetella flabilis]|uniref:(2Fe-2S)-binding protein n=1 Tax=Bordetella flabilis TaxID=463014 RepID=A0A193GB52_9BORD|nr:(2Fe-2S)-binding protein [Bordetella flabilis]ANN77060.1 (2Fe-2S)-binding protein [Bordetella flabilis]